MDTAFDHGDSDAPKSLNQAWYHCKEMFSAATFRDAWQSCQCLVDALPFWALLAVLVIATLIVVERSAFFVLAGSIAFLFAVYKTVRRAVADGIKDAR